MVYFTYFLACPLFRSSFSMQSRHSNKYLIANIGVDTASIKLRAFLGDRGLPKSCPGHARLKPQASEPDADLDGSKESD